MAVRSKVLGTRNLAFEEYNLFLQGWNRAHDATRGVIRYYNKEFGDKAMSLKEAIAVQEAANALKD